MGLQPYLIGKNPHPMHEIICPHCNKAFKIDEAGYTDILKQVRDGEFEQQLHERLELAEREKRDAIALPRCHQAGALLLIAAFGAVKHAATRLKLVCRNSSRCVFDSCLRLCRLR